MMTRPALVAALLAGAIGLVACTGDARPLIDENMIEGDALIRPLTGEPGDAARGLAVFLDEDRGHCVLCHAVGSLDAPFQGNLGPDLTTVATRLDAGQIRLLVADASRVHPGTIMPSYYRVQGLRQVATGYRGQPVLSAQEVEDVTAYLLTLTPDGA